MAGKALCSTQWRAKRQNAIAGGDGSENLAAVGDGIVETVKSELRNSGCLKTPIRLSAVAEKFPDPKTSPDRLMDS